MIKNKVIRKIALKALEEGRLWFRCADQYGRSCNGGDCSFRPDPATSRNPGEWTPRIDNVMLYSRGYHVTSDPLIWAGCIVQLVEIDEAVCREKSKAVCRSFRVLEQVMPWNCFDLRIWIATNRPYLAGSDLGGADLGGANLTRAYLAGAYLAGASLEGAYFGGWERGGDGFAQRKRP